MLSNVSSSIFTNSDSITLLPVVSAEWNHNLFNTPYLTVAGTGTAMSKTLLSGTVSDVTSGGKPNFATKSFDMSGGKGSVSYTITANNGLAYKVITYIKTNNSTPVMITGYGKGTNTQFGSEQIEADSLGWTKMITYIGSSGEADEISSFVYTINANDFSGVDTNATVYFTVPEIYETTLFDYKNHTLWSTESPFTYFRPGESYVSSGDIKCLLPSAYRKITSQVINGYTSATYSPISSIMQNPSFLLASSPVPALKNVVATDISPYKYFVSDKTSTSITALYEKNITTNKIVIKFNTIMSIPTLNIFINGSKIIVDGTEDIVPPNNADNKCTGLLTLYWTGSVWTKTKWSSMPKFDSYGVLAKETPITKITVTQISSSVNSEFVEYKNRNTNVEDDLGRMHLVEISPRLEIDLTDFVQDVTIDKSLDSGNTSLPISSINTNDARIILSGIPDMNGSTLVPIFSSQSNQSSTILSNMLRKNIKFYINFNLVSSSVPGTTTISDTYIPGGVFYSDTWDENDIQDVSIQCFDISRYLQSTPVPDYVANLKSVFDIITNILDLSGFTDYDYDGLYSICNSKSAPLDLAYYYCNSKDSTILDALNKIFVAYQIGAYMDEYGIMRFISLSKILDPATPSALSITESHIEQGGFAISNRSKPGKISLRYQTPKVKQSPSLQNATDPSIKNSPSFIYTTSNDVVWQQQTIDSVGFNYLNADMAEDDNAFEINNNDLLDIFHTFNLDNNGYAAIENEIVSFVYKEYELSNTSATSSTTVSVKNNIELASEIDKFIKQNMIEMKQQSAVVTDASGDGILTTYYAENDFTYGQMVSVSGMIPSAYNVSGMVLDDVDSTHFTLLSKSYSLDPVTQSGEARTNTDYDVIVTPTGKIANVQRGMFGTVATEHKRIAQTGWLASKGLAELTIDTDFNISPSTGKTEVINDKTNNATIYDSLPSIDKIQTTVSGTYKTVVYPADEVDQDYRTYSVKFDMPDQDIAVAGLFFNMESDISTDGAYFVELTKFKKSNIYKYILSIYDSTGTAHAWCDVTGPVNNIDSNFSKIITKQIDLEGTTYNYVTDNAFNLKVVRTLSNGSDGENATPIQNKEILSVFLNNYEITAWQIPGDTYDETLRPLATGWKASDTNRYTAMRQKPAIPAYVNAGTKFGFYSSFTSNTITNLHPQISYPERPAIGSPAAVREIHATKKPLSERSVSYFYQDREFLNGLVQGQPLGSNSPTYLMQTTPEISGINIYDVQYTSPAAVSVDILPIEYLLYYFPGSEAQDQKNYQKKLVDQYSLAYSSVINTGFRAKMAIANNSPHMVFLRKESDELNQVTVNLNLWTHEIVAPSDPEIIERIVDISNMSEVVQLDSEWIQSKTSANKMLKAVEMGLEGFSKEVSLNIFGNPLIQVGDIVTLSYSLNGISQQRYLVSSVSHTFNQGLATSLRLKRIQE
jgi:hypothetical protein